MAQLEHTSKCPLHTENPLPICTTIGHLNFPTRLRFKAVVFDLDGVVTDTAHLHYEAWKTVFDEVLQRWADTHSNAFRPFDNEDYLKYVDGMPRLVGVSTFLASRGIELPVGEPNDDALSTQHGIAAKKDELFKKYLLERGAVVYQSTVDFIKQLRSLGIATCVASSSKNCLLVLQRTKLEALFDARVDGLVSEALYLKGKPNPDIFIKCCELLGQLPQECVVVEDAQSGVEAGRAGKFGLVLGINRGNNRMGLLDHGADVVINDFSELDAWQLNEFFPLVDSGWMLQFEDYLPNDEMLRETLCTLGNGLFAVRGSAPESRYIKGGDHYPAMYVAGCYNRMKNIVGGMPVITDELVNWPNWVCMSFRHAPDGAWFEWNITQHQILKYSQQLNIREGILTTKYRVRDNASGDITDIYVQRIVHMKKPHIGVLRYVVIPQNWSGTLELRSSLDGSVQNRGVARYLEFNGKHLRVVAMGTARCDLPANQPFDLANEGPDTAANSVNSDGEECIYMIAKTDQSRREVAYAARTQLYHGSDRIAPKHIQVEQRSGDDGGPLEIISQKFVVEVSAGMILAAEKLVACYSSLNHGISSPEDAAMMALRRFQGKRFVNLQCLHSAEWQMLWDRCDITLALHPSVLGSVAHTGGGNVADPPGRADAFVIGRPMHIPNGTADDGSQSATTSPPSNELVTAGPPRPRTVHRTTVMKPEECTLPKGMHADVLQTQAQRGHITDHGLLMQLFREQLKMPSVQRDFRAIATANLQFLVRFHTFHLLQTASHNTVGRDTGIPARGLHGESYRGHIFWDEIFVLPFFACHYPEVSRQILLYRYFRLDAARDRAKQLGYYGACFPWQSASSGIEETPKVHYNPVSGRWYPDMSSNQLHINFAIFYNLWNYYRTTGDHYFLETYAAEMMLEIVRFWGNKCELNPSTGRYEIKGVMGPDEYHEKYPWSNTPGLTNNAYTNIMTAWCMDKVLTLMSQILPRSRTRELCERLHVTEQEINKWAAISRKMTVCFHDGYIISQFLDYDKLKELNWEAYRQHYGNIQRIDRILEAEGDSTDRYKLAKQADVVMLFALMSPSEFVEQMARLGYAFSTELVHHNIRYYLERCTHGSTLSLAVYAMVMFEFEPDTAWKLYCEFVLSDICDIQQGTTKEGIHVVPMAATRLMLTHVWCGLDPSRNVLVINPRIPQWVEELSFRMLFQQHWLALCYTKSRLRIKVEADVDQGVAHPLPLLIRGKLYHVMPGSTLELPMT